MKKSLWVILAGSVFAISAINVSADIGVSLKAGTLGAGVELSKSISDKLSLSVGLNSYDYKTTDTTSDINYDFRFELRSIALLASYHPFSGVFRLTAGVINDSNELALTGKPAGTSYTINGVTYPAAAVGSLSGVVTFKKTAPYLGIGWGNRPNSRFGLNADIGALYQGSPKLSLNATGAASIPGLAADIERERASAESDMAKFKWYPVLSLGMYYRF